VTAEEAREAMKAALAEVAPEADPDRLRPGEPLQDQLDLDSMDFLTFVVEIHERTGIDIPERDYPKMASPESCIAYLVAHSRD
jgi:acyl carrier protein